MEENGAISLNNRAGKFFFQRISCRIYEMCSFCFIVYNQSLMSFHDFFQFSCRTKQLLLFQSTFNSTNTSRKYYIYMKV